MRIVWERLDIKQGLKVVQRTHMKTYEKTAGTIESVGHDRWSYTLTAKRPVCLHNERAGQDLTSAQMADWLNVYSFCPVELPECLTVR